MSERSTRRRRLIRSPQDAAAGIFLVALGAIALWQSVGLAAGTLTQLGPAMVPRGLAVGVGLCGLALLVSALLSEGARLEGWAVRGPLMILGAAIAFGITVRPLGLAVAGPLAILGGALVAKLSAALVKALDDDHTRKRLLDLGGIIPDKAGRTPEYLANFVKSEVDRWTPILKAVGATAN